MIRNFVDLMSDIKEKGIQEINSGTQITHAPSIGDMYEGLTHELVTAAIFDGLNLHVCSGFIKNKDGKLSNQIDCMVVYGKGERKRCTNIYIYETEQVIAVIEVKKNLYSKEFDSAYQNLLSVKNLYSAQNSYSKDMAHEAYKMLSGNHVPSPEEEEQLSEEEKILWAAVKVEACLPLRVIWGYEGFKSEERFRQTLCRYIETNMHEKGTGYTSIPSLMIAGNNTLIKTNGMPFSVVEYNQKPGCFVGISSCNSEPLYIFLNMLWTRLYYLFPNLQEYIFGKHENKFNPLFELKGTSKGWMMYRIQEHLEKTRLTEWTPLEISLTEYEIIKALNEKGTLHSYNLAEILSCNITNTELEQAIQDMKWKRIIENSNEKLQLLNTDWEVRILSGKYYYGINFNHHMEDWYNKQIQEQKGE